MKIGPKYKIARRLGAPVFEKTQTQKFALREGKKVRSFRPKTDYGLQMAEKQKARMFYLVSEKQFGNYVKKALENKKGLPLANLYSSLERRLDNIVWRSGLVSTHSGARQAVAHGHFTVNGTKTTIPSREVRIGDVIGIREGSKNNKMFVDIKEKIKEVSAPEWLGVDTEKLEVTLKHNPGLEKQEMLFDLGQVIEFYQR